jgi:hypothetical protein
METPEQSVTHPLSAVATGQILLTLESSAYYTDSAIEDETVIYSIFILQR